MSCMPMMLVMFLGAMVVLAIVNQMIPYSEKELEAIKEAKDNK